MFTDTVYKLAVYKLPGTDPVVIIVNDIEEDIKKLVGEHYASQQWGGFGNDFLTAWFNVNKQPDGVCAFANISIGSVVMYGPVLVRLPRGAEYSIINQAVDYLRSKSVQNTGEGAVTQAPASDVAPPGFRIVGRSEPGVPMPKLGTWIRFMWSPYGEPPVQPFDPPRQWHNYTYERRLWNERCFQILEPTPAKAT